jgi:hypothetical protein
MGQIVASGEYILTRANSKVRAKTRKNQSLNGQEQIRSFDFVVERRVMREMRLGRYKKAFYF